MDKYLILIKNLESELIDLNLEIKNIESEIKEKKLSVSNLESIITITSNKIKTNQIKIDDKRNMKKYFKTKKIYYFKIFIVLFFILSSSLLLTGILFSAFVGMITKILISLGLSSFIVGGVYFLTTKDDLKYFNSIDVDELCYENYNFSEGNKLNTIEKNKLKIDVRSLEEKYSQLQKNIATKKEKLNEVNNIRNEIINNILNRLVEQEIGDTVGILEDSKQKVLSK